MFKKLLLLIIIIGIGYGVYWMIDRDGAIEIKNKIIGIFHRNKTIENLINNDGESFEDGITVDSGLIFSGDDSGVTNTGNIEEIGNAILESIETENIEFDSGSLIQESETLINNTTTQTTQTTTTSSTTKNTVIPAQNTTTTTTKTTNQENILKELFE